MALLDGLLPGWARTIVNAVGGIVARRVKAKADDEVRREKLRRDAERDNAEFEKECADNPKCVEVRAQGSER